MTTDSGTTTNVELTEYAKILNIPNLHCVMRDEILKISKKIPLSVIVNSEPSSGQGKHWRLFM